MPLGGAERSAAHERSWASILDRSACTRAELAGSPAQLSVAARVFPGLRDAGGIDAAVRWDGSVSSVRLARGSVARRTAAIDISRPAIVARVP